MMLGLRTTIYKAKYLLNEVLWYPKVFETVPYCESLSYVGCSIKGYELGLLAENYTTKKVDNVLTYWGGENVHDRYECLLNLGEKTHQGPIHVGGEFIVATVLDPWNNALEIIYNTTFKVS